MLYPLVLEGSGTHPMPPPKPVQHDMKHDFHSESLVQESGNRPPKHFGEENPTDPPPALGIKTDLCQAIFGQRPITELCLHYGDHLLPIGGIRIFFSRCLV